MKKKIFITGLIALILVLVIDYIMLNFGRKRYCEITEKKGAVIKGDFSSGIIAYGNDNLTIYKWEISSIKELKR